MGEIDDDARKESGFRCAQREPQPIELRLRVDEAHRNRDDSPGEHDARYPLPCAPKLNQERARDLEHKVTDKKYSRAKSKNLRSEAKLLSHLEIGVRDVETVEVVDDVEEEKVWNNSARYSTPRSICYVC